MLQHAARPAALAAPINPTWQPSSLAHPPPPPAVHTLGRSCLRSSQLRARAGRRAGHNLAAAAEEQQLEQLQQQQRRQQCTLHTAAESATTSSSTSSSNRSSRTNLWSSLRAFGPHTPAAGSSSHPLGSSCRSLSTHSRAAFALAAAARHAPIGGSTSTSGSAGPAGGRPAALALCAAGPRPPAPLLQSAGLTRNQLLRGDRKPKPRRRNPTKALKGGPQRKGICVRVYTVAPKKPNSANRTVAKVALSTGVKVVTYVPGEGHNLQVRDAV
jgi:hypothetical protein